MFYKQVYASLNQSSRKVAEFFLNSVRSVVALKESIALLILSATVLASCTMESIIADLSTSQNLVTVSADKSVTNGSSHLTLTFSEPQTNLTLANLQVTNGVLSDLSGGPLEFQVTVQPTADGVVELKVPSKKIVSSDSGDVQLDSYKIIYDTQPPVITTMQIVDPLSSPSTQFIVKVSASVNEDGSYVEFFSDSACAISIGASTATSGVATLSSNVFVSGVYHYYSKATDIAGNTSSCSLSYASYELDLTAPSLSSLTIALQSPSSSPGTDKTPTIRVSGFDDAYAVYLYKDSSCSSASFYGSSYTGGQPSVDITSTTNLSDGEYHFYAKLSDALSNISSCSAVYATYIVDTGAPSLATSLTLQNPLTSPGNDNTPTIQVFGVESGATVSLYTNSSCTVGGLVGSAISAGVLVDVTTSPLVDGTYTFYANVTDIVGNNSGCSTASISYVVDTQGPSTPSLALFNPASSPSNNSAPVFRVSGVVSGDSVKIYSNNTCTTEVASGVASATTIDLSPNTVVAGINSFYARAIDPVGNPSACSAGVSYNLDTVAPNAPSALALQNPLVSPSNNTTPTIRVSGVVSGDVVTLYKDSSCTLANAMASGTAAGPSIDLTSSVLTEGNYQFYARSVDPAGNASGCSTASIAYSLDLTVPANPTNLSLVNPVSSPSSVRNPTIRVAGVSAGDTVKLTHSDTCAFFLGSEVASGNSVDVLVPANFVDGLYNIYVQVVDASGNSTACLNGSLVYTVDTVAPNAPSSLALQLPTTSPNNNKTPTIRIGGVVAGDSIALFTNSACNSGTEIAVATAAGASIDLIPSSNLTDGTYSFYSRATDLAGNQSPCSTATVSYSLDTVAPSNAVTLALQNPLSSPSNMTTPTIRVSSVSVGDTVKLYTNNTCSTEVASGVSAGTTIDLAPLALTEGSYYFYARMTDPAGNVSACSTNNVQYVLDTTPPAAPSALALQTPSTSPKNNTTPTIRISGVVSGDTVALYKDSSCSTPNLLSTGVAPGTTVDLTSSALADGAYSFYARATDPQGNASACSTATVAYTVDTVPPATPLSFILKNPASSPSKISTPEFTVGGVEVGSRVILYKAPGCSTSTSGFVDSTAAAMDVTSTSLADGIYTMSVLLMDTAGNFSGCYSGEITYQVDNAAPTAPTGLALQNPSTSPSNDTTPTIRVSGTVNTDTVRLYTDSSCTTAVGSAVAAGTQVDVTTTVLGEGVYDIYANSTDVAGNVSSCSSSKVSYNLDLTAPTVTLSSWVSSVTIDSIIQVNVTLSEAVTGFTLADISVTNGTAQNFTGSGTSYSFEVQHSASGAVSVQIAAGSFADAAGNPNSVSNTLSYTYEKAIWSSQAYIKAPNAEASDMLGRSELNIGGLGASTVAIDGDTVAVGAMFEDSNQTTITNGNTASGDNSKLQAGAVYVFKRTGVIWANEAYIKASNADAQDMFGISVALKGDTLVVGAVGEASNQTTITNGATSSSNNSVYKSGAVYVYKRNSNNWSQEAYIKAVNSFPSYFGSSVSLDGDTLAVGAIAEASSQTTITNGTTASSSFTKADSGAVYVYHRAGTTWTQQAYIKASNADQDDIFGLVSLSGDRLAVSAAWESSNQTTINNSSSASTDNSASKSGAVYVFKRSGVSWQQEAYIKAVNAEASDSFGYSISLSGETLAVSALVEGSLQQTITNGSGADSDNTLPCRGAVYIYRYNGSAWSQEAYIKPSNLVSMYFGISVSLSGDQLSVGAAGDYYKYYGVQNDSTNNGIVLDISDPDIATNPNVLQLSGAVYMYRRTGTQWAQEAYIKAPNADENDFFGLSVSLDKNSLAVVAPHESSAQTTISNGATASSDNSSPESGALYIYTRNAAIANISAGLPNEIASTNSINVTVGGSNITNYRYKVGPASTTDCSDLTGYSAAIPVATPLAEDFSSYSDGKIVVCLIGQMATGLWQNPANATSYSWIKDTSAPTAPSNVLDGVTEWTDNTTTPAITWTASTDSTGIAAYEVSLGTSAGATDLMAWTSTGSTATSWSGSGLNLSFGTTVYVNVRAKDLIGNVSGIGSSDGYLLKYYGWQQQAYIKAYNSTGTGYFGYSVAISGDTLVSGAPMEDSNQTTITNGTSVSFNTDVGNSGAAYVYKRTGNNWEQEAYIKASNAELGDLFGYMVAIDGDTIAVSAGSEDSSQTTISNGSGAASADNSLAGSGAVYIYKRTGTVWAQEAYIKASNAQAGAQFGNSLALVGDTLAVGAYGDSSESTTILNGSTPAPMPGTAKSNSGAVFVYKRTGVTWAQEAYIKAINADAGDLFGASISLSGNTLAVGANYEKSAETTIRNDGTASADNSLNGAGAVYVYTRTGTNWAQEAYIKASNSNASDVFGIVSLDGDTLAVGAEYESSNQTFITNGTGSSADNSANHAGAVYIYKRTGTSWAQEAYIKASNAQAGDAFTMVSLSGDYLAVGAPFESSAQTTINNGTSLASADNSASQSGAVYIFKRTGSNWAQTAYIKAANACSGCYLGFRVSLQGTTLTVGTPTEKSNYLGVMNGSTASTDTSSAGSGAVYVYKFTD